MSEKFDSLSFMRELLARVMQEHDKLKNKMQWLEREVKILQGQHEVRNYWSQPK